MDAARAQGKLDSTAIKVFLEPHPSSLFALVGPHFPAEAEDVSALTAGHVVIATHTPVMGKAGLMSLPYPEEFGGGAQAAPPLWTMRIRTVQRIRTMKPIRMLSTTGSMAGAEPPLEGVLPIDKPAGPTSHDMVARTRRALGTRRVGHTGTLDPFASGLLLLCIGRATRIAEYLSGMDKRYSAVVRLGVSTDTLDASGTVTAEHDTTGLTRDAVENAENK